MILLFVPNQMPFPNYSPLGWIYGVWRKCHIYTGLVEDFLGGLKPWLVNSITLVFYILNIGCKFQHLSYEIPRYTLKNGDIPISGQ